MGWPSIASARGLTYVNSKLTASASQKIASSWSTSPR